MSIVGLGDVHGIVEAEVSESVPNLFELGLGLLLVLLRRQLDLDAEVEAGGSG